jgi:hypothetical protein
MIGFNIKINKKRIEKEMFTAIKDNSKHLKLNINSIDIVLEVIDLPGINLENKTIYTKIPVQFNLSKDAALFSMNGKGKLYVELKTDFDISANLSLTTKTEVVGHSWIEEPILDFGALDFTVEKLVNMIINHYRDSISSAIDKTVKDHINLKQNLNQANQLLKAKLATVDFKSIQLFVEFSEILVQPIETKGEFIHMIGAIRADLACGVNNTLEPTDIQLRWVESLLSDNISYVNLNITEEIISSILCEYVNSQDYGGEMLVSSGCKVDFQPNRLSVVMNLDQPIKATINIDGIPKYNEHESKLYVENLSVNINAAGFLYKLSAPLLNKFLTSKIKENLPVDIENEIAKNVGKYYKGNTVNNGIIIDYNLSKISIDKMNFHDEGIEAIIKVSDVEATVTVPDFV